jgi:hypothetical protein
MTFLDHIKHLAVGLTPKEKVELTDYLCGTETELSAARPTSLRGDWRDAFSSDSDVEADLKEIRSEWQSEWCGDKFVG